MTSGGYERWDDGQPRGARRRSPGRTDDQRASDPYGYNSPDDGAADDYAGADEHGRLYGGDGYPAYGDYPQGGGYPADGNSGEYGQNGYDQNGYGQNGYGENGYADDRYGAGGYADDGHRGGGYADDDYRGGGGYAADEYGQDAYAARDPYSTAEPYGGHDTYGGQDAYGAGDQYGGREAYPGADPQDSAPHGRTDPRGMTDPRGVTDPRVSTDPYQRGRDPYEPAGGAGYGGQDDYPAAAGYGQDDFGGQDRYGSSGGYQTSGEYDRPDDRYTYAGNRAGGQDQPGQTRRSTARAVDPDEARHEGFFSGFGNHDDDDLGGRRSRKDRGERKSHAGLIALGIVVVIFLGIAGAGFKYYNEYKQRHSSYTGSGFGTVRMTIKPGDTPDSIASKLLKLQVIKSIDPWAAYVANKTGLQPGEFKLHEHMSPAAAWALLVNPKNRVSSSVTIPDGLRVSKILPLLAKDSGIPLTNFETAITKDIAQLGLPSWANGNPEGFLYPDTYDITPGSTTALQILQMAVHQFNVVTTTQLNLAAEANQAQFTELQVITEASLLEGEVGPTYFADVARVIDNRLNMSPPMDLQLDSTVAYVTGDYSYNFTQAQLSANSPAGYNTFVTAGLPAGPIDSPDLQAIQAVLAPAPSSNDWLYFVTVNKAGLTEFTDSNSQFQTWSAEAKQNGV